MNAQPFDPSAFDLTVRSLPHARSYVEIGALMVLRLCAPFARVSPSSRSLAASLLPHVQRVVERASFARGESREVASSSKPGTTYRVSAAGCSCPGFKYRGKCRHVDALRAQG